MEEWVEKPTLSCDKNTYYRQLVVTMTKEMENIMTQKEQIESTTEQLLLPLLNEHQFELVDVEFVKEVGTWYLRAYIDKPGGITINDCETVSRAFNVILDEKDYVSVDNYVFEVSSPGLTRPLKKEKDYIRNIGKPIEIRLFTPVNKQKELTGILLAYDADTISLDIDGGEAVVIQKSNLALIRQAFVL